MPSTDNATDCNPKTTNPSAPTTPTLTPGQRRVAAALAEVHQATASELKALAGVGKSSAAMTLVMLEEQKAAIRTVREHDGVREANLWSPGPTLAALLSGDATAPSAERSASGPTDPTDCPTDVAGIEPENTTGSSPTLVPSAEPSAATMGATTSPAPEASTSVTAAKRLAPGELATMVEAVLTAHPDIEYTPTMVSHMLEGRSAGAIHNVLEKMATSGTVRRTCDKPKRYQRVASPAPKEV